MSSRAERPAPIGRRRILRAASLAVPLAFFSCEPGKGTLPAAERAMLPEKVARRIEEERRVTAAPTPAESVRTPESLQLNLPKMFPVKVEISEESPRGRKEEGWKWVTVQLGFENTSSRELPLGLFREELDTMVIRTKEDFQYKPEMGPLEYGTHLKLPPGFRTKGIRIHQPGAIDRVPYPLIQVGFRVAQKTSGYKLVMPGFSAIDLEKDLALSQGMKFPTDRPDSDFREIGETITVPGRGGVTLLKVGRDGYRFRYENASHGYGTSFTFWPTIIDTDGIWWAQVSGVGEVNITVGPGLVKEEDILETRLPISVKGGKLILAGDINEIFNLRFE